MLFIILSIVDILAGAAVYSPTILGFLSKIIWTLTIIILFKGIYSITSSFSSGYYFEWPGFLDVIAGASLFLISHDLVSASHIIGGLVIGKGTYYLTRSVLGV